MTRGRTDRLLVTKVAASNGGEPRRVPDDVIVEEPLEIRLDDHLVATTMRTPGHDFELAVGWCHAEGLLADAPVTSVRYCGTGSAVETAFNVVTVETGGLAAVPEPRLTTATSSCGLCGSTSIEDLAARLLPRSEPMRVALDVLATVPARVREAQALFTATGAVHAAAAFGPDGSVLVTREDVGRHNAVDKVVGRLLLDGLLPATDLALFVSGRASFEIVQKAWSAGFGLVLAVSAPSSLAVRTARVANVALVGFARDDRMNVYAPERW